jgi:pantoate--beta-alanine ligase
LNPEEREAATVLYRSLTAAEKLFSSGSRTAEELRQEVTQIVAAEPLAKLQYVSCAHPDTLEELEGPVKRALLSMAVYVGKTRLIDNLSIEDKA